MTEAQSEETLRVSRVGKRPVVVPAGVTVDIKDGKLIAKGPKGQMERQLHAAIEVKKEGDSIVLSPAKDQDSAHFAQFQGLTRALIGNAIEGVSKGFTRALDLIGTGYKADLKGQDLTLSLGLSHPVHFKLPTAIKARVEILDVGGTKKPRLHLESHDKELLGQVAARIRSFRPPEPYKGKGVRYVDEKVREKAGKGGKK
jgi:large subunit ribosomal protein L6